MKQKGWKQVLQGIYKTRHVWDLSRCGVLPANLQEPGRWHQAPGKRENFSPPSLAAYFGQT